MTVSFTIEWIGHTQWPIPRKWTFEGSIKCPFNQRVRSNKDYGFKNIQGSCAAQECVCCYGESLAAQEWQRNVFTFTAAKILSGADPELQRAAANYTTCYFTLHCSTIHNYTTLYTALHNIILPGHYLKLQYTTQQLFPAHYSTQHYKLEYTTLNYITI